MFCVRCGSPLPEGAAFCPRCGAAVALAPAPDPGPAPAGYPVPAPGPTGAPIYPWDVAAPAAPEGLRYGGFWRRLWAFLLDGILLNAVMVPVTLGMGFPFTSGDWGDGDMSTEQAWSILHRMGSVVVVGALLGWLYAALMQCSARQATVGQMALGLRVSDLEGRRIGFGRATGRHFAAILTGLTFTLGYIAAAFTSRKQTLHDLIAGTLVLRN